MAVLTSGTVLFDTFDDATLELANLGTGLGPGGDFNGDGFTDLLISANLSASGAADTGTVFVVFGGEDGFEARVDLADPTAWDGFRIDGMAGDTLGKGAGRPARLSVADVNDDGIDDILLGVPRHGTNDEGRGYIVFGTANSDPVLDLANFTSADGIAIGGTLTSQILGWRFENLGDIDGDGLDEIGLNTPFNSGNILGTEPSRAGVTLVFDNIADAADLEIGTPFYDLTTDPDDTGPLTAPADGQFYTGSTIGERSGGDLAALGDFNGDGIADFVIASEDASVTVDGTARNFAGAAHVVLGGSDAATGDLVSLAAGSVDGLVTFVGPSIGSDFGARVAGAGDVDGDGRDDLLVSTIQERDPDNNFGAIYLIYGEETPDAVTDMAASGNFTRIAGFGTRAPLAADHDVTGLGDVNGDGFDDFLITTLGVKANQVGGASGADGVAWLVFGKEGGLGATLDLSSLDGSNGFVIASGATTGSKSFALGKGAAALGDINGDGYADFAISADRDEGTAEGSQGAVYVFHGGPTLALLDAFDGAADGYIEAEALGQTFDTGNAAPVGQNADLGSLNEADAVATFDLASLVTDPDGDPVTLSMTGTLPDGASFSGTELTVDPNAVADALGLSINESQTVTLSLRATDDNGAASDPFEARFTVTGIDDPTQVSDLNLTVLEGDLLSIELDTAITDVDGDPTLTGVAPLGTVATGPDAPVLDEFDLPGVLGITGPLDLAYLAQDPSDVDLGAGTTPIIGSGAFGPLAEGETRTISFTYFGGSVIDRLSPNPMPSGTITIKIIGQNDAPVAQNVDLGQIAEDAGVQQLSLAGAVTDPDADPLTISAIDPLPAGVSLSGTDVLIDPDQIADALGLTLGESETVTLTLRATDDNGAASDPFEASFTVTGVDDPTQVRDLTFNMFEGQTLALDAVSGISDIDGTPTFFGVAALGGTAPDFDGFDLPGVLAFGATGALGYVAQSPEDADLPPTTPVAAFGAFDDMAANEVRTITFTYFGSSSESVQSSAQLSAGTITINIVGLDEVTEDEVSAPVGTSGDDVLTGTDMADTFSGKAGNDTLSGLGGNDLLNGGGGKDTVSGGAGDDTLNGNSGNDSLTGGSGADTIKGGSGKDEVRGGTGNDRVFGNKGRDDLKGGGGGDMLSGGSGRDVLKGGAGKDTLKGGGSKDSLNGGGGNDRLFGGGGQDALNGGRGDDRLTGGRGADTFIFGKDSGDDVITDFKLNTDTIKIRSVTSLSELTITSVADDALITFGKSSVRLLDVAPSRLDKDDFEFGKSNAREVEANAVGVEAYLDMLW